jgi:hypothetical protein
MGLAAWVLVLGRLAGGEPGPSSGVPVIVWDAPASCPSQDEVARAIASRVENRQLEVRASVREAEGQFVAALAIASETGTTQRSLASPSCVTLVDAVVLLAVVATDPVPTIESIAPRLRAPEVIPEAIAPAPMAEPLPMIGTAAPIEPPPVSPAKPPRSRRIQPRAAAFAIFGGRTLPGLDVGVRGAIGVATPRVHVDATALWLGPRETVREEVRATIDAWAVGVRVCPVVPLPTRRVELPICAVLAAGQLRGRAESERLISEQPQNVAWVTAAVAPELAVVVHRLVRIVVGVEVGGALVRPGFAVEGLAGRLWRPQPWIARGQLGLEVRFR